MASPTTTVPLERLERRRICELAWRCDPVIVVKGLTKSWRLQMCLAVLAAKSSCPLHGRYTFVRLLATLLSVNLNDEDPQLCHVRIVLAYRLNEINSLSVFEHLLQASTYTPTHINLSINPLLNYLLFANQGTIREEKPVPPPTLIALWILHPTAISPYPFTASPGKRNSDADSDISYKHTTTTKNIHITHYNINQHLYLA